jgi:hypothetical protein
MSQSTLLLGHKHGAYVLLISVWFAFAASSSLVIGQPKKKKPSEMTLGEARGLLLGKNVIVQGQTHDDYPFKGELTEWQLAVEQGNEYVTVTRTTYLPDTYQGKEAEVVAVQLDSLEKKGAGRVNALGETVSDAGLVNPYTDLVVKFPDGTIALTTQYLSAFFDESLAPFRLSSARTSRVELINSKLPSILGRTVYPVAISQLYLPTASLETMLDIAAMGQRALHFKLLEPMNIVAAKYNEQKDVIILKLREKIGTEYLTVSTFNQSEHKDKDFFETVVDSSPASLLSSFRTLAPREVAAIRAGKIITGMYVLAVYCAMGMPDHENQWSRGGRQLVYFGGKFYVYLDSNDRVVSWQDLDR